MVYRVEFTKRSGPKRRRAPTDPLGGGNELLWQLTGGTETMTVTRMSDDGARDATDDATMTRRSLGRNLPVLPNNHGPQTDRLVYGLGPFQGYDSGDPTSREVGLYDQAFVDSFIHHAVERRTDHRRPVRRSLSARREGHLRSGQPEPRAISAASPARAAPPAEDVFTGFNVFSIALEVPIDRHLPATASRTTAR